MNLLDTSADRVHASVIQRAQMEAESLAAFARKNGLALKVDVELQRDQVIVVRDAATPAPTMVDERGPVVAAREQEATLPSTLEGKYALWVQLFQDPELQPIAVSALGDGLRSASQVAQPGEREKQLQELHNELYRAQTADNTEVLFDAIGKARLILSRYRATRPSLQSLGGDAGVPEGWQLVPKEPTAKMMDAAWNHTPLNMDDMTDGDFGQAYKDMLAAAPSLTSTEKSDGGTKDALRTLVEQIEKCMPVDDHGHDFTLNRAFLRAKEML